MKIREEFKIRQIAGESVLIKQGTHGTDMTKIIALNETSVHLWNHLSGKEFTVEDIVTLLRNRYEVDETTAKQDATRWMDELILCGIIQEK